MDLKQKAALVFTELTPGNLTLLPEAQELLATYQLMDTKEPNTAKQVSDITKKIKTSIKALQLFKEAEAAGFRHPELASDVERICTITRRVCIHILVNGNLPEGHAGFRERPPEAVDISSNALSNMHRQMIEAAKVYDSGYIPNDSGRDRTVLDRLLKRG